MGHRRTEGEIREHTHEVHRGRFCAIKIPQSLLSAPLEHVWPHRALHLVGFYEHFFLTAKGKLVFLDQCATWPCHGDPTYTYSDVERAVGARLTQSQIVAILSSQIGLERRRRELALLSELKARYEAIAEAPVGAEVRDLFG
jgi:hypothetical protein